MVIVFYLVNFVYSNSSLNSQFTTHWETFNRTNSHRNQLLNWTVLFSTMKFCRIWRHPTTTLPSTMWTTVVVSTNRFLYLFLFLPSLLICIVHACGSVYEVQTSCSFHFFSSYTVANPIANIVGTTANHPGGSVDQCGQSECKCKRFGKCFGAGTAKRNRPAKRC